MLRRGANEGVTETPHHRPRLGRWSRLRPVGRSLGLLTMVGSLGVLLLQAPPGAAHSSLSAAQVEPLPAPSLLGGGTAMPRLDRQEPPTPTPQTAEPRAPSTVPGQVAAVEAALRSGQLDVVQDYGSGSRSQLRMAFDLAAEGGPRLHLTARYETLTGGQSLERIVVGDRVWERSLDGGWSTGPALSSVAAQVQPFLPGVATAPAPAVFAGTTATTLRWHDPDRDAEVTLEVDPATLVPRQLWQRVRGKGWTLDVAYRDWNAPVAIAPPSESRPAPALAGAATPAPARSAADVVQQVTAAEAALRSGQFQVRSLYDDGTFVSAELRFDLGDAGRAARFHLITRYVGATDEQVVEQITIGAQSWQRGPDGVWSPLSGRLASVGDQVRLLLPRLDSTMDQLSLSDPDGGPLLWHDPHRDVDVFLYVDPATGVPQRLHEVGADGPSRTVTYSGWNVPVEIAPPPAP